MRFHYDGERLDIIGLVGIVIVGLVVGVLSFLLDIGQYGFAIAFLIAGGAYAIVRYNGLTPVQGSLSRIQTASGRSTVERKWSEYASHALAVLFLIGSVVVLSPAERPPAHFILVTLAFGTVLFDIAWGEPRRSAWVGLIVAKIVLITLVYRTVRFFVLATMPGFDTQGHLLMATHLAETGSFPPEAGRYAMTPVWHAFVAGFQLLGLDGDLAVFAVVVGFAVFSTAGAYLLGRELIDPRGGLYAALLVSVSDMFLLRGLTNITPSAIVIVITIFVLYLLYTAIERPPLIVYGLVILAYFTHQLSSFVLLLLLWALWGGQWMYDRLFADSTGIDATTDRFALRFRDVSILVVPMLFQWSIAPVSSPSQPNFLFLMGARLWNSLMGLSESGGSSYAASLSQHSVVSNILYTAGYSLLLVVGMFGVLLWLHPKFRTRGRFATILAAGVIFLMVYPLTLVGLGHLFLPHRILVFLELFLALFGAAGIRYLYRQPADLGRWVGVSALVLLLVFFMITTPFINRDNPVYEEDRVVRIGLTENEVAAVLEAAQHADGDRPIYVDGLVYPPTVRVELQEAGLRSDQTIRNYPSGDPIESEAIVVDRAYYRTVQDRGVNADINTFGLEDDETERYTPRQCRYTEEFYRNEDAVVYVVSQCGS